LGKISHPNKKIKALVTCTKVSFEEKINMPYYEDLKKLPYFP
jgi:hypothetical protein